MSNHGFPEDITRLLSEHDFGVLATSGTQYPHTSLVTVAVSDDREYLLFPTLRETRKYENLNRDSRVSILFDNRSTFGNRLGKLYALSALGTANEVGDPMLSLCKERFLLRHPHLADFLSLQQTALIQVAIKKLILVEEFGNISEFDCPPR